VRITKGEHKGAEARVRRVDGSDLVLKLLDNNERTIVPIRDAYVVQQ
jgi:hypothetical protein